MVVFTRAGFELVVGRVQEAIRALAFLLRSPPKHDLLPREGGVLLGKVLDKTKEALSSACGDLKNLALDALKESAESVVSELAEVGGAVTAAAKDAGGEELVGALGLMTKDFFQERSARRDKWRVREVAALCARRLISSPSTPHNRRHAGFCSPIQGHGSTRPLD